MTKHFSTYFTSLLTWLSMSVALFALAIMTSCSDETLDGGYQGDKGQWVPLVFNASLGDGSVSVDAVTRAMKSEDVAGTGYDRLSAYWQVGDSVTVVVRHDDKLIITTAKLTKVHGTGSERAEFVAQLKSEDAAMIQAGDVVSAYSPALVDGSLTVDYTQPLDGTVGSLAKLDPVSGSSVVSKVDEKGIAVSNDIKMQIPDTDNAGGVSFGSAYYGIKVQRVDSLYKDNTLTEVKVTPLKIKKLTLSVRDKAKEDNGWYSLAKFDPQTQKCNWSRTWQDDSIVVATADGKATDRRLYMAVPKMDAGIAATFCAQDSDGYVYTVDKIIPAEAGTYYPVTLTMHLAQYVSLGDTTEWATHNVGAKDPTDYGDYFAWGEVKPSDYYSWTYPGYEAYYHYKYGAYDSNFNIVISKYNPTDQIYILDADDDAATANWGKPWRMPYADEIWRLCNRNLYSHAVTVTDKYGENVIGIKITSKKNGNSIFFPYGGQKYGNRPYARCVGGGYYWGKELYFSGGTGPDGKVQNYYFPSGRGIEQKGSDYGDMLGNTDDPSSRQGWGVGGGGERYIGRLVRPVRAAANVRHVKQ